MLKTLNDLQKDFEWKYDTFVGLKNEANKWKAYLKYRLQIEDEQLKLTKVEILGQIELLNKFFNLNEEKQEKKIEQAKKEERKKFIEIAEKTAEMLIRSCKNPKEAEFTKTVVGNIIYQIEELERKEKNEKKIIM